MGEALKASLNLFKKVLWFYGTLEHGLLGGVACGLPFTSPFLYNETYINKVELFSSIFVPNLSEVSYMVCSRDSVCELWFTNLMLPLNLCLRMLGQLRVKICKALELAVRMLNWLGAKICNALCFH